MNLSTILFVGGAGWGTYEVVTAGELPVSSLGMLAAGLVVRLMGY